MRRNLAQLRLLFSILLLGIMAAMTGCAGRAESASVEPATRTPQEIEGESLFSIHCGSCHSKIPESVIVGPSLAGIASRAGSRVPGLDARQYVEDSIMSPGDYVVEGYKDLMPVALGETLTKEEVDALIAFLMTLED